MIDNLIKILLSATVAGSIMFFVVCIMDMIVGQNDIKWQDFLAKLTLLVFAIPMIALLLIVVRFFHSTVKIVEEDFEAIYFYAFGELNILNSEIYYALGIIWLAGFSIALYLHILREHRMINNVIKLSFPVTEPELINFKEEGRRNLKIKKNIDILYCDFTKSPFLTGIAKPKIIFPKQDIFNSEEKRILILHELVHCKKQDVWFSVLLTCIQAIHWFNPLLHIFLEKLREYSELACDSICINIIGDNEVYADLIIKTMEFSLNKRNITEFASRTKRSIQRRLYHIMKKNTKRRNVMVAAFSLYLLSIPFVSYASTFAVLKGESLAAKAFYGELVNEEVIAQNTKKAATYQQATELVNSESDTVYLNIAPNTKGVNGVDITLRASQSATFNSVALKAGDTIRINVEADYTSDTFRGGYIYGNKKTYVSSSNGEIDHTFNVKSDGSYTVFFENSSSGSIRLLGRVYIN